MDVFIDNLDLQILETSSDGIVGHMRADSRHQQASGIVHGGVHATLMQELALHAAQARLDSSSDGLTRAVPVVNRTDFIRQHESGPLTITGRLVDDLDDQQIWAFRITRDSDGALVASGEVHVAASSDESPPARDPPAPYSVERGRST